MKSGGYYSDRSLPGVGGVAIGLTRLFYVLDEQGMLNRTCSQPRPTCCCCP